MKTGTTISAAAHSGVLLWALVSFGASPLNVEPAESMPIDIISSVEFSQLKQGLKEAPKREIAKPFVEKVAEPRKIENANAKVSEKPEVFTASSTPSPPNPQPQVAETPPVPPRKPEAKPAEPEKKPTEAKVDPIADALKKDNSKAKPEESKVVMPPKKPETKPDTPDKKPELAQKKPQPPQPKFDAERIAALLDKREPVRRAATGDTLNATPALGTTTGNAPQLSQSELDALRAQIQACWNPPAGALDGKDLIVRVRLQLNQNGSLSADPTLLDRAQSTPAQIAAESALRAVRRCQPYRLPIAKYEVWRDVEVTFDPRDMFRG